MRALKIRNYSIAAMAAVVLTGCAVHQAGGQARAAQRIIAAYNVPRLLSQASPVLTQSLIARLPDSVGTNKRQRIRRSIDEAYATRELTRAVRKRLERQARKAGRRQALVQAANALESPLATRMLRLQNNAGGEGFAKGYNAFMQQPLDARRKARLRQLQRLIRDMGIIDVQTAFKLTLLGAMVATLNAAEFTQKAIAPAAAQALLERTRRRLRHQMRRQVPLLLLYVYRNVDDHALRSYVQMQSAMVWVNQALVDAIQGALESAGKKVAKRIASVRWTQVAMAPIRAQRSGSCIRRPRAALASGRLGSPT